MDPTEDVKPACGLSLIAVILAESSFCLAPPLVAKMLFSHYQNSLKAERKLGKMKITDNNNN